MTDAVLLAMPGNDEAARRLAAGLVADLGNMLVRHFPDGESYVRLPCDVRGRDVIIVCTLSRPDEQLMPLLLAASAARDHGARSVALVAPYLAYMRQDKAFRPGEAVSARCFARLLSANFDWLVTVDPHLHRIGSLAEIYTIPTRAVSAAPAIAQWIRGHLERPTLVSPDEEGAQWVRQVADIVGAASQVLAKQRSGDKDVTVSAPDARAMHGGVVVILDDIISTARTMVAAAERVRDEGLGASVCIGIHALFAGDAQDALRSAGAARVVTCDTVPHPTNEISVMPLVADAIREIRSSIALKETAHE